MRMVSIPREFTLHGILEQANKEGKKVRVPLVDDKAARFNQELLEANPGAFIVDLHCRPPQPLDLKKPQENLSVIDFGNSYAGERLKKPSRMKVSTTRRYPDANLWIAEGPHGKRSFSVEVPAVYSDQPPSVRSLADVLAPDGRFHEDYSRSYLFYRADLKKTLQSNALHTRTLDRVAHALDAEMKTVLGKYRRPKGRPHIGRKYRRTRIR